MSSLLFVICVFPFTLPFNSEKPSVFGSVRYSLLLLLLPSRKVSTGCVLKCGDTLIDLLFMDGHNTQGWKKREINETLSTVEMHSSDRVVESGTKTYVACLR